MEIKILNSNTQLTSKERNKYFIIGTHNGVFHSDEVVACAILCLLNKGKEIQIIRTRDDLILNQCYICVDIGGGNFDHHQPNFNSARDNGIPYASAGLVWKYYGEKLVFNYMNYNPYFCKHTDLTHTILKKIDDTIISLVDCEDNGISSEKHLFSFISDFLPLWFERKPDFDKQFYQVLKIVIEVLEQNIIKNISDVISENILLYNYSNSKYFSNGILEIPSQTINWLDTVIKINDSSTSLCNENIDFVIFPYPDGGWAAQCVPPNLSHKFEQRIPFPKSWAGQTDKLPEISQVTDATFCHNGCFFVRAKTKESVIKLCRIAIESFIANIINAIED